MRPVRRNSGARTRVLRAFFVSNPRKIRDPISHAKSESESRKVRDLPETHGHGLPSGPHFPNTAYHDSQRVSLYPTAGRVMSHHLKQLAATALFMIGTSAAMASNSYLNIPAGTNLPVRISESLNSEKTNVGDSFHGTLATAVVESGRTLLPKGADVTGEVLQVERSGRLSSPGELHLALRTVHFGRRTYEVAAQTFVIKGESHKKSNLTKIGGGTAAGAIIGAIAGGGKGAAIGAGVGAAAGTGVAAATGKKPAEVESEAILTWVATAPPSGSVMQGEDHRQHNNNRYDDDNNRRGNESSYDDDDRRYSGGRYDRDVDDDYDDRGPMEFSPRERRIISDCFVDNRSNLPPGLAKRDRLPPGLERQLQRNGTLPPGLQKRMQPLPGVCTARLPRLPQEWVRVVLGGRIILLDPTQRIVDLFWLDNDE